MNRLASAAALALAVALAGACDAVPSETGATPAAPSGIRGTVILAPTCPIGGEPGDHEPVPCLTPYAAQLVILDGENQVVERISSGEDGRFEVNLAPGDYVITPLGGDPYPIALPQAVTVQPSEYALVQVNYDTGIR